MAVDGERKVAMGHAAAVVGDADPPPPAAVGEDVDPAGAGIDGVLHQFLDHAGRPLDHFAGGDAVDDGFGELADGHGAGLGRIRWHGDFRPAGQQMHASGMGNPCYFATRNPLS